MERNDQGKYRMTSGYHLSPGIIRNSEIRPSGIITWTAASKRNRLDETLSALDHRIPQSLLSMRKRVLSRTLVGFEKVISSSNL